MSDTNRFNNRRNRRNDAFSIEEVLEFLPVLLPVDVQIANADQSRPVLDAVIRSHHAQLVAVARRRLGNRRHDAEDIVQEVCLAVLEGQIAVPSDPSEALDVLLREVIEQCEGGAR